MTASVHSIRPDTPASPEAILGQAISSGYRAVVVVGIDAGGRIELMWSSIPIAELCMSAQVLRRAVDAALDHDEEAG